MSNAWRIFHAMPLLASPGRDRGDEVCAVRRMIDDRWGKGSISTTDGGSVLRIQIQVVSSISMSCRGLIRRTMLHDKGEKES